MDNEDFVVLLHKTIRTIIHEDIPNSLKIEYTEEDKNDKIHILYNCLDKTLNEFKNALNKKEI